MTIELKIKMKTLACEAGIIRREEKIAKARGKRELRASLYHHRINTVRVEARATQLARTYLRGRAYRTVEQSTHGFPAPVLPSTLRMINRYGSNNLTMDGLREWIAAS